MSAAPRCRAGRGHGTVEAVSDIVGSLLLVGITVLTTAVFSILILSYDGPPDTLHAEIEMRTDPGSGGWSTGDETVQVVHLGGEPLAAIDTRIRFTAGGIPATLEGAGLGSAFADGQLTIGETWQSAPLTLARSDVVDVLVAQVGGTGSAVLGRGTATGSSTGAGPACALDVSPPTAAWAQAPTDVTAATAGAVAVTATLSDGCAGVDAGVTPHIHYRVTPAASFTDGGAMTSLGGHAWSASIAPPGGTWGAHAGQVLEYYAAPLTDLATNTGQSGTRSDTIDIVATYTYVASHTTTKGTVDDFAGAQSATDGDAQATLDEGSSFTLPGTGSGTFGGTTTAHSGATNPAGALSSDDVRAVLDSNGEHAEVYGLDLPPEANGIVSLTIGFEGRKHQSSGQSPVAVLSYNLGGTTGPTTRAVTLSSSGDDTFSQVVTADRVWTVADVEQMRVRVAAQTITNRHIEVDHIFATVVYATGGTTYSTDIRFDWTGVPAGTQQVQVRYSTAGDTFTMQAWDFTAASWRACPGTLSSATLTVASCNLLAPEVAAGAARVRFVDNTPSGTAQGSLFVEYARAATT